MSVLGLDIGTTGSRAVVVNDEGTVVASATAPHAAFESPHPGWAEQDPADWWRASQAAIADALADNGSPSSNIRAVGLSGQMHGAVLLDDAGEVLRPAIIWCDQRTDAECRWLTETIGAARLVALVSNPALTGFTLPKLLWVRTHEPRVWDQVRSVLLPKDYVRLRLTGERATDVADASGTLLFDVANREWSRKMLEATGIDASCLPTVHEGPRVAGRVTTRAANDTGLPPGIPVVAGGGDQATGAVGMGIVRPGTVSATIGTSGVVFAATDRPALDPSGRVHTCCHAVPGRWHVMGVTQGAGLSLRWFKDTFGAGPDDGRDPYDRLCDEAAGAPPGAEGVLWAPYLMGERTPHLDPHARAALVGLTAPTPGAHHPCRARGRRLQPERQLHDSRRDGGPGAAHQTGRRRGSVSPVASDPGRRLRSPGRDAGAEEGSALWRGAARRCRGRCLDERRRGCDAVVRVSDRIDPDPDASARLGDQYDGSGRCILRCTRR